MTTEEEKMNPDTPPAKGTEYVVLIDTGTDDGGSKPDYRVAGRTTATSKEAAVKAVASEGGSSPKPGSYKAVPARSWDDTVKLDVLTVTKVTAKVV
jgi:hypothetical protein